MVQINEVSCQPVFLLILSHFVILACPGSDSGKIVAFQNDVADLFCIDYTGSNVPDYLH